MNYTLKGAMLDLIFAKDNCKSNRNKCPLYHECIIMLRNIFRKLLEILQNAEWMKYLCKPCQI